MRSVIMLVSVYFLIHILGYTLISHAMPEISDIPVLTKNQLRIKLLKELDIDIPYPIGCAGYPTSNPSENFCSTHKPENWVEHQFNGEEYYLVPLLGTDQPNTPAVDISDFNN